MAPMAVLRLVPSTGSTSPVPPTPHVGSLDAPFGASFPKEAALTGAPSLATPPLELDLVPRL